MSFKRILVAVDDGEPAVRAADAAIQLAHEVGATIAFVNVIPSSLVTPNELGFVETCTIEHVQQHAQSLLRCMRDRAQRVPSDEILRNGVVCEEIVSAAREWRADLIVVGNHVRPLLERLLLSNTTNGVLHGAPCPVLVVSTSVETAAEPVQESSKNNNRRLSCENAKQICH